MSSRPLPKAALRQPRKKRRRRAKKKRKPRGCLQRLEFAAFLLLRALLRSLSLKAAYRLSACATVALFYFTARHRQRALAHLEIAFGDRSLAWRRRVFWTSVRHLGYNLVEVIIPASIAPDPALQHGFDLSEMDRQVALDGVYQKRGAIVISSHLGNSDFMGTLIGARGWVLASANRVIDNPYVYQTMVRDRSRFGRDLLDKKGLLRSAMRRLNEKGMVGLLIDQDMGSSGIFVPYFGVLASTTGGAGYLAVRSGAAVWMIFLIRLRERRPEQRFYCYPLEFELTGDRSADIRLITARATAELEKFARRYPEQAFWPHRRWKTRPPDEQSS